MQPPAGEPFHGDLYLYINLYITHCGCTAVTKVYFIRQITRNSIKLLLLSISFCYAVHLLIYYTNICKIYETIDKKDYHVDNHMVKEHHEDNHIKSIPRPQDKLDKVDQNDGIHIVEEHHHVWPVWKRNRPSAVVHIDAHPDTGFNGEDPPNANDVFIYQANNIFFLLFFSKILENNGTLCI